MQQKYGTSEEQREVKPRIMEMAGTKDPYSKPPEKDNCIFFGHINRADGIESKY